MKILTNDYHANIPSNKGSISGGTGRFATHFSQHVVKAGHQWVGLLNDPKGDAQPSITLLYKKNNKTFYEIKMRLGIFKNITQSKTFRSPKVILKEEIELVRTIIKKEKPDIVFLNGFYGYLWVLFEAARLEGVPVVVQHAGVWAKEIRQYADQFTPAGRRMCYWIEKESAKHADANIFLNKFSRDAFIKQLRLKKVKGGVVIPLPRPDWIDSVKKIELKKDISNLTLGVIARWDRIKNHEAVLALAKEIKRKGLGWKIKSVVNIPESKLKVQFKKDYRKYVDVVGRIDHDKIPSFIKSVDCLIVPSKFETASFIVLEGLSCGRPVLVSPNIGFSSEYYRFGASEWVVDFSNSKKVIKRIQELFDLEAGGEKKLNFLAEGLYDLHSPQSVHKAYLDLFKSLIV